MTTPHGLKTVRALKYFCWRTGLGEFRSTMGDTFHSKTIARTNRLRELLYYKYIKSLNRIASNFLPYVHGSSEVPVTRVVEGALFGVSVKF